MEVKDFELVISLPYNLRGFVQATNICEAYTKLLNKQVEKDEPLEVGAIHGKANFYFIKIQAVPEITYMRFIETLSGQLIIKKITIYLFNI